jgi:excinuclease UvrABC ATPase subunit
MANRYNHRQKHAVKLELQKQANIAAGSVADRFPTVSGIVIHMAYYRAAAIPLLMMRTVNICPASFAMFKMDCMIKTCDGGGFDLTAIVAKMVKTHTKVKKGVIVCQGTVDPLAPEHARIEYETVIQYKKASEKTV